jgi:hypothetical protein
MNMTCKILVAATFTSLSASAFALEEHVGLNAEKGDPARWYQPADTPQLKYRNALKEAGAALAEAKADCRGQVTERKACEADAREQYRRDVEAARAALSQPTQR